MSLPSYKNLLKRSRSSIDHVMDCDNIIHGIAFACKSRQDGDGVFSSPFSTDVFGVMTVPNVSSVSQIAQIVAEDSLASKFLDQTLFSSNDAVTLARSPTFPFDSNKALIRWLRAGRKEEHRPKDQAAVSRRRKRAVDCAMEPDLTSCFSSPITSTSMNAVVEDGNAGKPMHPQASERASLDNVSQIGSPSVILDTTSPSHVSEKVSATPCAGELGKDAVLPSPSQVLSSNDQAEFSEANPALEPASLISRRVSCISRDRCPQFGVLSVCGRRREMEDTCTVEPDLILLPCDAMGGCSCMDRSLCGLTSFHFFGVYDGHGGIQASSFCKARLHKVLTEELIKDVRSCNKVANGVPSDWTVRWRKVMESCFLKIDEEVGGVCPTGGCGNVEGNANCCINPIAPDNVGSTAVVVVVGPCQIIVGNCGDSRAVLSRGGKLVPLSKDHKPDREDEMNRIIAVGGRIIYWDGYRVGGLLAMSRAIGDRFLKQYVVALPEVTCVERTKEDECLILASDGLWDVVSSEMACDVARRRLKSQRRKCAKSNDPSSEDTPAEAAASLLTKLALSRGSKDNISVIVIDLKSYHKKSL